MKLTEQQLKKLKKLNDSKVNEILGITTLVVGKWYKYIQNNEIYGLLMYNDSEDCSGFWDGNYSHNYWAFYHGGGISEEVIPATKEEIEEALIKEAKKRGFKNIGDLSLISVDGYTLTRGFFETCGNRFDFCEEYNILRLDHVPIFKDGNWAEIIDEKSDIKDEIKQIEQRLKELRDKL